MNRNKQIVAVMSSNARLSFTASVWCMIHDLLAFGVDVLPSQGTTWEASLTLSIEKALKEYGDRKYILFYDGDGTWAPDDFERLYAAIEANPTLDAVWPCQSARNSDVPLAYGYRSADYDGPAPTYDQPLQEQQHGHFACSLIRMDVFRRMRQPWFLRGATTSGHLVDSDTWFWFRLWDLNRGTGRHVAQVNGVLVGHLELMVRYPDGTKTACMTLDEFYKRRRPPDGAHCPTMVEARAAVESGHWEDFKF